MNYSISWILKVDQVLMVVLLWFMFCLTARSELVHVSHIYNPCNFYVNLSRDLSILTTLSRNIHTHCSYTGKRDIPNELEVGECHYELPFLDTFPIVHYYYYKFLLLDNLLITIQSCYVLILLASFFISESRLILTSICYY